MKHISNEEKAKEIMNKFYGNLMPHYTHNEVFDRCFRARYADILEAMEWKDERHAKERQALIQKYEDKLNKLNQREETIRDNVRRANSRYGFEGLF